MMREGMTAPGMDLRRAARTGVLMAVVGVVLAGCVARPATTRQETTSTERVGPPKTIRIGTRTEPISGLVLFAGSSDAAAQHMAVFHAGLTVYDAQGNLEPRVAQKVPRLEDGDWKVLPDGGMELTWKLRRDVKWHDGTPLTADDYLFGLRVAQDPELPLERPSGIRLISQVTAPDAETLVVRFSGPYVQANRGGPVDIPAVPRHLLADIYQQGDRQSFTNSPYWSTEFVGLGPYRLGEWVLGSYTEALAFDQYFLGRPTIDRVVIRYLTDANVAVTNVLAGEIDLVAVGLLKPEDLQPVMGAWGQGGGTVLFMNRDIQILYLQLRDPNGPWVRDMRARQALVHLLDRQTLAETFAYGLSSAEAFVDRQEPVYGVLEQRGFARYPYDTARAAQLLADAGWTRGADGLLTSGGERFTIEVRLMANSQANVSQALGVADLWKQGGLNVDFFSIPPNTGTRGELKVANRGVFSTSDTLIPATLENFISTQIPTDTNGWNGRNFGSYVSPEYDQLYAQFVSELDVTRSRSFHAELLRHATEHLPYIPLYYSPSSGTTVFRRGITGPGPVPNVQPVTTWNIHTWQVD